NEEGRKNKASTRSLPMVEGEGDKQQSGSFKTVLMNSFGRDEGRDKVTEELKEVLNVEVDAWCFGEGAGTEL
ncbi:hypothetical protein A2U01_0080933, partial [Trifolium medium]|nr:hypothetical protein [Trifolium medium]